MNNNEKIVFNVPEICKYLHTSESSIRKLIRTKQIPHYRILSRIFFDKETIDMWINNQQLNNLTESLLNSHYSSNQLYPSSIGGKYE